MNSLKTISLTALYIPIILLASSLLSTSLFAAELISGPMQGYLSTNSVSIWVLVKDCEQMTWTIRSGDQSQVLEVVFKEGEGPIDGFRSVSREIDGLDPERSYKLDISLDGEVVEQGKNLILSNKEETDFSFLVGSCAEHYAAASTTLLPVGTFAIFKRMSRQEADFMLWTGDHLYYKEKDWSSYEGMFRKFVETRSHHDLNLFLKSMPQVATWDDHEYGPDNSGKAFDGKSEARKIFSKFWANPYYGEEYQGIYSNFIHKDCEFFLTDVRYFRDLPNLPNSKMLGEQQMAWLKNQLKSSKATFKFVVVGTQAINTLAISEGYRRYAGERQALLDFIKNEKIEGVIFLSGDRHFAELYRLKSDDCYPLYDFTSSPLTSFSKVTPWRKERDGPTNVPETFYGHQNFGKVSVAGQPGKRKCTLQLYDNKAKQVWKVEIDERSLKF